MSLGLPQTGGGLHDPVEVLASLANANGLLPAATSQATAEDPTVAQTRFYRVILSL